MLERDGRCARCSAGGQVHWHHRRSRRVRDGHMHCPCNGIALCDTCHTWAHHHPTDAMQAGLIVSSYITNPSAIPVKTYRGWVIHDCAGGREKFPSTSFGVNDNEKEHTQ